SIGASVARNFIGYNADGTPAAREVKAYAQGSSINAKAGDLLITATSKQTIHATVTAVSAAVAGSLVGRLAASRARVDAENKIGATIQAYIDGDGASSGTGVQANTVTVQVNDESSIKADAESATIAVSVAPTPTGVGATVSIGTTIALNTITNDTEAGIK